MKRLLAVVLAVVMVFSLAACGNEQTAEKYCSNCKESITENDAFCKHCGTAQNNANKDNSSDNSSTDDIVSTPTDTSEPSSSTPTESSKPVESSKPTTSSKPTESSKPTTSSTPTTSSKPATSSQPTTQTPTHKHSYSTKVTAATCTAKGYTTYTCSCGDTYKDNYTDATHHNYKGHKCVKCNEIIEFYKTEKFLDEFEGVRFYYIGIEYGTRIKIRVENTNAEPVLVQLRNSIVNENKYINLICSQEILPNQTTTVYTWVESSELRHYGFDYIDLAEFNFYIAKENPDSPSGLQFNEHFTSTKKVVLRPYE